MTDKLSNQTFLGIRYPNLDSNNKSAGLTNHDIAVLKQISSVYGENMHTVIPLSNYNDETFGGHVQVLHPQSKLDPNYSLPGNMFGHISMVPLRNNRLNEGLVKSIGNEEVCTILNKTMTQYDSPSIKTHYSGNNSTQDKMKWSPSLNGGHMTIHSLADQYGKKKYFLTVESSVGSIISSELRNIANEKGMTANKFINDKRVVWAKNLSNRNNQRLLAIGARYFTDPKYYNTLHINDDYESFVPQHHLTPQLLEPSIRSSFNTISAIPGNNGKTQAIAIYYDCADGNQNIMSSLVRGDYLDPLYEFQGKSLNLPNNQYYNTGKISNKFYNAVPSFTSPTTSGERNSIVSNVDSSVDEAIGNNFKSLSGNNKLKESRYGTRQLIDMKHMQSNLKNYGLDTNVPQRQYNPVYSIFE